MMSEEDYEELPESFRKFKKKLLEMNPELVKEKLVLDENYFKTEATGMKIGDRIQVKTTGCRGEIKYIGLIPEIKGGWFIGIKLDEPFGKVDGRYTPHTHQLLLATSLISAV